MFKFFSQIRLSRALITNSFLRETCTIYTICFLIPGLTKLLESNFQAVEDSMLSRGPSETSKVRGCFEFLTTSRGRIRALFFPPSPLLFLSSHFSLHRSLFQRHVSTSFLVQCTRGSIWGGSIRAIHCEDFLTIQLPLVCRIDHLYRTISST